MARSLWHSRLSCLRCFHSPQKVVTMKEGTLVYHPEWGKGLVVESMFHINGDEWPPAVRVLWNKPKTMKHGGKLTTLKIYEQELTILSETAG